jgi:hypothetical protein
MTSRAGDVFLSAKGAAIAAIEEINPTSIARNIEFAGRVLERTTGFTFVAPRTLGKKNDSDPGPKTAGSVGTYHTHSGEFEPTDEIFSPTDKLKATMGKELSFLGTPRGRILQYTPIDLLSPFEQSMNPDGLVETLKFPRFNSAHELGAALGRWAVERPSTGDSWDVIYFNDGSVGWTQGTGADRFVKHGTGSWWIQNDNIMVLWRADLAETWPLPLRPKRQIGLESTGARLVARRTEGPDQNPKSKFSVFV